MADKLSFGLPDAAAADEAAKSTVKRDDLYKGSSLIGATPGLRESLGPAMQEMKDILAGRGRAKQAIESINRDYQEGKLLIRDRNQAIRNVGSMELERQVYQHGPFYAAALKLSQDVRDYFDKVVEVHDEIMARPRAGSQKSETGMTRENLAKMPANDALHFVQTTAETFIRSFGPQLKVLFDLYPVPGLVPLAEAANPSTVDLMRRMGFGEKFSKLAGLLVETTGIMAGPSGKMLAKKQGEAGDLINAAKNKVAGFNDVMNEPRVQKAAIDAAAEGIKDAAPRGSAAVKTANAAIDYGRKAEKLAGEKDLGTRLSNYLEEAQTQARGVEGFSRGHEEAAKMLDKLDPLTQQDWAAMAPGVTWNQEKVLQANRDLHYQLADFIDMGKRYLGGETQLADPLKMRLLQLMTPLRNLRAEEIEAGRAGEIKMVMGQPGYLRNAFDALASFNPEAAAQGDWEGVLRAATEKVTALGEPDQIRNFVLATQEAMKGNTYTIGDRVQTAYKAILLAKPATWMKKALGDVYGATDSVIQRSAAGWLSEDAVNGVQKGEGAALFKGYMMSLFHTGSEAFGKGPRFGFPSVDVKGLPGFMDNFDTPGWAVPLRAFESITDFAQKNAVLASFYTDATMEGMKAGLSGEPLYEHVISRMTRPTVEMLDNASELALNNTFTNPLGAFGRKIQKMTQGLKIGDVPAGQFVFPFAKVPENLTNRELSMIPGVNMFTRGILSGLDEGGRARDMALGRFAMADWNAYFLSGLAKMGWLTGSGPQDPGLRKVWQENHTPHTLTLFGQRLSLNPTEPYGKTAAIYADLMWNSDYIGEESWPKLAGAASSSILGDVLDSSYWQIPSQIFNYVGSLEKGDLPTFVAGTAAALGDTAGAVLSGGPAVTGAVGQYDQYRRQYARGPFANAWDRFKASNVFTRMAIPNFLTDVPYAIDPFSGEKKLLPAPWGSSWFGRMLGTEITPFTLTPDVTNPRYKTIEKFQGKMPRFDLLVAGKNPEVPYGEPNVEDGPSLRLDGQQEEEFTKLFSQFRDPSTKKSYAESFDEMTSSPTFQGSPPEIQNRSFNTLTHAYLMGAREQLFKAHPELMQEFLQPKMKRYLDSIGDPAQRASEQQRLSDEINKTYDAPPQPAME